jgi:outer membrane protein OmpA-like peptidoglycan-associated protein
MSANRVAKSFAAAAAVALFAAHAATAQEAKNLPPGATAHFVYFPTGGHALDSKDESQTRDVAGMMQTTPDFVATIVGKTDSVGTMDFNEHLSQRRAEAVFEALVYENKVPENRIQMCWTGERLPFIATADETAESQNRMVAIIVSKATDAHFCGG